MVLKVTSDDEKSKRRAMRAVAAVEESVAADMQRREITVIGEADPVVLAKRLMKLGFRELLSVGPAKEEKGAAETPTVVYHHQVNPHYGYGPYEGYSSSTVVRGEYPNGCTIC